MYYFLPVWMSVEMGGLAYIRNAKLTLKEVNIPNAN